MNTLPPLPSPLEVPPALVTQVCDHVVDLLHAGSFSQEFSVRRYRDRRKAVRDVDDLTVAVMPQSTSETRATRGSHDETLEIAVAVLKRIAPEPPAGQTIDDAEDLLIDELVLVAQEITRYLRSRPLPRLACGERAIHSETQIHAPYVPEHWEQRRLFVCPITLTYRRMS